MNVIRLLPLGLSLLFFVNGTTVQAQRGLSGEQYDEMPFEQPNLYPAGAGIGSARSSLDPGVRPIIMLTGYWPKTNFMIRHFSPDPIQNPDGWKGSNWEGRGYDVYAYFAEFPGGSGQGIGDLEVDYQDTSLDFWAIADNLKPIAVITFSRGGIVKKWELEWNNRNLVNWIDDYTAPFMPTPSPPDASMPDNAVRNSTLPLQDILDAVRAASLQSVSTVVDFAGNGGGFLSEFIAYHGVWYQAIHADPSDPAWCIAGGHVHVGSMISLKKCIRATEQTLRATIRYMDQVVDPANGETLWFCPTQPHSNGAGAVLTVLGSQSITRNDMELLVVKNVPSSVGLAFYGAGSQPPIPFGDGQRCVSAPIHRVNQVVTGSADGFATIPIDFSQGSFASGPGQVAAGDEWHFQFWVRDQAAGQTGFTASSGLSLTLTP
ncbi:MAG: hypothetical protein ACI8X5_003479 [Planctomycetota bacterium]|jgi:hypothetical protein